MKSRNNAAQSDGKGQSRIEERLSKIEAENSGIKRWTLISAIIGGVVGGGGVGGLATTFLKAPSETRLAQLQVLLTKQEAMTKGLGELCSSLQRSLDSANESGNNEESILLRQERERMERAYRDFLTRLVGDLSVVKASPPIIFIGDDAPGDSWTTTGKVDGRYMDVGIADSELSPFFSDIATDNTPWCATMSFLMDPGVELGARYEDLDWEEGPDFHVYVNTHWVETMKQTLEDEYGLVQIGIELPIGDG